MKYYPILQLEHPAPDREDAPACDCTSESGSGNNDSDSPVVGNSPRLPDAVPGCLIWLDATSGVETVPATDSDGSEYTGVESWTDRVSGVTFTGPDRRYPAFHGNSITTTGGGMRSLSAPLSIPVEGEEVVTSVPIMTLTEGPDFFVFFDSEYGFLDAMHDGEDYSLGETSDLAGSDISDVLVDGVSIIDHSDVEFTDFGDGFDIFCPSSPFSGELVVVLKKSPKVRIPLPGASTVFVSVNTPDIAGEYPIYSLDGLFDLSVRRGEVKWQHVSYYYDGSAGETVKTVTTGDVGGTTSEIFAISTEPAMDLSGNATIASNLTALVAHEGEYVMRPAGASFSQLGVFDEVRRIDILSTRGSNGFEFFNDCAYHDIAIFDRVLSQSDIEAVCKALAEKRSL